MERVCPTRYFFKTKPPRRRQVVRNVGQRLPFSIERYVDERMMAAAEEIVAREKIDIVRHTGNALAAPLELNVWRVETRRS